MPAELSDRGSALDSVAGSRAPSFAIDALHCTTLFLLQSCRSTGVDTWGEKCFAKDFELIAKTVRSWLTEGCWQQGWFLQYL